MFVRLSPHCPILLIAKIPHTNASNNHSCLLLFSTLARIYKHISFPCISPFFIVFHEYFIMNLTLAHTHTHYLCIIMFVLYFGCCIVVICSAIQYGLWCACVYVVYTHCDARSKAFCAALFSPRTHNTNNNRLLIYHLQWERSQAALLLASLGGQNVIKFYYDLKILPGFIGLETKNEKYDEPALAKPATSNNSSNHSIILCIVYQNQCAQHQQHYSQCYMCASGPPEGSVFLYWLQLLSLMLKNKVDAGDWRMFLAMMMIAIDWNPCTLVSLWHWFVIAMNTFTPAQYSHNLRVYDQERALSLIVAACYKKDME